ncbi:hypothetical protein ACFL60_00820 [Candidatus Omnitrophota bacterium]
MVERITKTWRIYVISIGVIFCVVSFSYAGVGLDEKPAQFFIKSDGHSICNSPKEVTILALDFYGLIDTSFEGLKPVSISVKEVGGKKRNSFKELPKELEFQKGKAAFFIENSEPETLEFTITQGDNISPFPASITFKEASVIDRIEINLASRGNINEPQKGSVAVLDKEGNVAVDYNQKGLKIEVEESGAENKSFTLTPASLDILVGEASFSITNSEEDEEILLKILDPKSSFKPGEASITFLIPDKEPPEIIDIKMETLAFVELIFSEELDDGTATDTSNYKVVCSDVQTPRSVEFHGDRVILELDDLLRSHSQMYVEITNLKDIVGNEVERDARSPDYSVPYVAISLEINASSSTSSLDSPVTVSITARCTSGRIPQFINAQFEIDVTEGISDNSFDLSQQGVQMTEGKGEFTISNSSPEKLTIIIRDPDGEVTSSSIELEFI